MATHSIPDPFVWDASFEVFYKTLDDEHKGLFDGIRELCANNNAANLTTLATRVKNHFSNEEGMMKASSSYTDYTAHKAKHDAFVADLSALSAPIPADKASWAKDWLVQHIKNTDFGYKGKL